MPKGKPTFPKGFRTESPAQSGVGMVAVQGASRGESDAEGWAWRLGSQRSGEAMPFVKGLCSAQREHSKGDCLST